MYSSFHKETWTKVHNFRVLQNPILLATVMVRINHKLQVSVQCHFHKKWCENTTYETGKCKSNEKW